MITLGLLIALSTPALRAQEFIERAPKEESSSSKRKWIRRVTLAATCAASLAFDSLTTRRAVAAGAMEENGLLSNSQGSPAWGRVLGVKAAACGISTVIEETHTFGVWNSPKSDWTWTAMNVGTASMFTWAGFHNLAVADKLTAGK